MVDGQNPEAGSEQPFSVAHIEAQVEHTLEAPDVVTEPVVEAPEAAQTNGETSMPSVEAGQDTEVTLNDLETARDRARDKVQRLAQESVVAWSELEAAEESYTDALKGRSAERIEVAKQTIAEEVPEAPQISSLRIPVAESVAPPLTGEQVSPQIAANLAEQDAVIEASRRASEAAVQQPDPTVVPPISEMPIFGNQAEETPAAPEVTPPPAE